VGGRGIEGFRKGNDTWAKHDYRNIERLQQRNTRNSRKDNEILDPERMWPHPRLSDVVLDDYPKIIY
jgi:hypothetical protein